MAMEAEALLFQQDLLGYNNSKDPYTLFPPNWICDFGVLEQEENRDSFDTDETNQTEDFHYANWSSPPPSFMPHLESDNTTNPMIPEDFPQFDDTSPPTMSSTRPKRRGRCSNTKKNKEDIENQRMTHIAVERNRRRQMNEYLSMLRSLMPDNYVQRADQASIIGGAINYVRELEQQLQFLSSHKGMNQNFADHSSSPFAEFITFPQYMANSNCCRHSTTMTNYVDDQSQLAVADIEVTMVENHANLKIRSKRRPKQLLKMVSGLQSLKLTILHLNVTTVDQVVLYTLSVKVEDNCQLASVDEIASAVNQMLGRI